MLALLCFLSCIEKLSSIMNLVAVEKDWVSRAQNTRSSASTHYITGCCCRR
jgi:hypothetical protein